MPEPMTDERLAEIRDAESRNLAKLFDSTVTELLAEVDRLRADVKLLEGSALGWQRECAANSDEVIRLRAELIQVAAVAVAWVEAIDRREVS